MARHPVPGTCKTRLSPPLAPTEAADLYQAFLEDIAAQSAALPASVDRWVAWAAQEGRGAQAIELLGSIFGEGTQLLEQRGSSLTDRMEGVFADLLGRGYGAVVMRNSDSPHLPTTHLTDALETLATGPEDAVVLGPDRDGGYALVGLSSAPKDLFPRTMSTASVLQETIAAAQRSGRMVTLLEPVLDIDTEEDLRAFVAEARQSQGLRRSATWRSLCDGAILTSLEATP